MSESVRVKEMVTYRDVMHQKRFIIIFLVGLFLLLEGSFYVFFTTDDLKWKAFNGCLFARFFCPHFSHSRHSMFVVTNLFSSHLKDTFLPSRTYYIIII